jgi:DNA-binding response OmpR family regulator
MTGNDSINEKLEMFELGVDDYILKPIELHELEARVKVLMKRAQLQLREIIEI